MTPNGTELPPVGGNGCRVDGRCTTEQVLHRAGDEVGAIFRRQALEPEAGVDRVPGDRDRTLLVGELAARPVVRVRRGTLRSPGHRPAGRWPGLRRVPRRTRTTGRAASSPTRRVRSQSPGTRSTPA